MISSRTWTRELLSELIETRLGGVKFIVVSNREPHMHSYGRAVIWNASRPPAVWPRPCGLF